MISFTPFLPSRDSSNFSETTPPDLALSQAENARNLFTPQLRMRVQDTFPVVLKGLPIMPQSLPFKSPFKSSIILATASNSLVSVQFRMFNFNERIYDITAKGVGESLITAFIAGGEELARLRVIINPSLPKPASTDSGSPPVDVMAALQELLKGVREGLEARVSESVKTIEMKLLLAALSDGGKGIQPLLDAFHTAYLSGVKEGWQAFIDMIKGIGKAVFDSKFRDELIKKFGDQLVEILQPATAALLAVNGDISKVIKPILRNARQIGRTIGEEIATEAESFSRKPAVEISRSMGRLAGLAVFEITLQILMEIVGFIVTEGLIAVFAWAGEGAVMVARLVRRLKPLIEGGLDELKAIMKSKWVGTAARDVEKVGAMAGEAAARFSRFWKSGEVVPRKFSAAEIKSLTEKIASRMRQLGVPEGNIGIRGIPGESGEAFNAIGRTRGVNVRGRGISVHGSVEKPWTNFPEWNAASLDARIDAIIAHEWMEFNELTHWETVELGADTKLAISKEARDLLIAMQKRGRSFEVVMK